jgi:arylsulfatase
LEKLNFILLLPDQHRGDWLPYDERTFAEYGLEPLPLNMPNVRKLMDEGMVFTKAITPSPLCAPARACLASGLSYKECGVTDNGDDYPLHLRTFYSVFKEHGYSVGGVGKFDLNKATPWWGLEGWREELSLLGFTDAVDNAGKIDAILFGAEEPKDPYMKYLHARGLAQLHVQDMATRKGETYPTPLPDDAYCDNWLSAQGIGMLRDFPQDRPWFMQVNFTGPHNPWDVTAGMKERWQNAEFPEPNKSVGDGGKHLDVRRNYAAMLENIDRNIGLLFEEIKQRGEWERTVIVYTSDHGEMLGDCGKYGKTYADRASVHIPFIVSGPGIRRGFYSDALVELQDVGVTLLDLAGLDMPEAKGALSLAPVLRGEAGIHRRFQRSALTTKGKSWSLISDGTYKCIVGQVESPRLYHLPSDPWENHNVADGQEGVLLSLLLALEQEYGNGRG